MYAKGTSMISLTFGFPEIFQFAPPPPSFIMEVRIGFNYSTSDHLLLLYFVGNWRKQRRWGEGKGGRGRGKRRGLGIVLISKYFKLWMNGIIVEVCFDFSQISYYRWFDHPFSLMPLVSFHLEPKSYSLSFTSTSIGETFDSFKEQ